MAEQQRHLPKDEPATQEEVWGYSLETFLEDKWMYLLAILIVLGIFLYARHSWRRRHRRKEDERQD